MVEPWGMVGYQLQGSYQSSPPKVGFGVICRCPGRSVVLESIRIHSEGSVCLCGNVVLNVKAVYYCGHSSV